MLISLYIFIAALGSYCLGTILELMVSVLLIFCGLSGLIKKGKSNTSYEAWLFFPAALVIAIISGLIGGAPPIINYLYQQYNITPKQIVGTKSVNLFTLQVTKSFVYLVFIIFHTTRYTHSSNIQYTPQMIVTHILPAIIGAAIGISIGRLALNKIDTPYFTNIVNIMLLVFGFYFLYLWVY